jgi:hypothetical protein
MLARTDKSVTVLTGMIIAALYLILLIGFSQESYMRRDAAAARFELASAASATGQVLTGQVLTGQVLTGDAPKLACRAEHPICATLFTGAGEQEHCANSVEIMRRLLGEPGAPLTLERLRSALHAESAESPPARF